MPHRTAKFAPVLFVSILAGVPIAATAYGETAAGGNCLANPTGETPAGSHWYYRIDHVNKRNCWHLRHGDGGVSQATPESSQPASPEPTKSIADAHAEVRSPAEVRNDPPVAAASPPPASVPANDVSSATIPAWNATAAVSTRWPDAPPASQPAPPQPATTAPAVATPATAAPVDGAATPTADSARAVIPSIPLAGLSATLQPRTILTLIAGTLAALAFAGAAALITRRRRRVRRRVVHSVRAPIWETTDDDRIVLSDHPLSDARDHRPRFARGVGSAKVNRPPEFAKRAPRYARR
jgi:hypothetical protein